MKAVVHWSVVPFFRKLEIVGPPLGFIQKMQHCKEIALNSSIFTEGAG
jgi:hypothetical protein